MNIRPLFRFVTKNWWWIGPIAERAYNYIKPKVEIIITKIKKTWKKEKDS